MSNSDSDWLDIFDRFSQQSRNIQRELNARIAGVPESVGNLTWLDVNVCEMRRLLDQIDAKRQQQRQQG